MKYLTLLGEYKQSHAVTAVDALALARFVEWLDAGSPQETSAPLSMDETQRVLGAASHEPMSTTAALDRFSRRHNVNVTDEQIKHMVNRFLAWRLPENFQPDAGISFNPEYNVEYNAARGLPPARHQPNGTNLFDATQAEAMVRYMVEGMPCAEKARAEDAAFRPLCAHGNFVDECPHPHTGVK